PRPCGLGEDQAILALVCRSRRWKALAASSRADDKLRTFDRRGGIALAEHVVPACRVRVVVCFADAKRHSGRAGDHGRGDQQHERRADLHRGQEGLLPRRRPGRQGDQFSLGGGHGGAAWGRPDRSRRRFRLGWALQRGCARHQDQDRGGQGVVPAGLRRHQSSRSQGSCRERTLQVAPGPQGHEVRDECPWREQYVDAQHPLAVRRAEIFRCRDRRSSVARPCRRAQEQIGRCIGLGGAWSCARDPQWRCRSDQIRRRNPAESSNRGLLYSEEFASKRADAARRFMRAYIRAVRFYNGALKNGRLDGANADDVIAILSEATPIKSRDIYKLITPTGMNPDGRVNKASLAYDLALYAEQGLIKGAVNLDEAVDGSFVEAVLKELGPYRP